MKKITKEWLEAARLDLETIQQLLPNDRLTAQVAFHAQQAVEKALKALIEDSGRHVPRVHSLEKLFAMCEPLVDIEVDEITIIALDSLYTDSRYPGDFGLLPSGKPSIEQAKGFYEFAQKVYMQISASLD